MEACLPVSDVHLALDQPSARLPEESSAHCAVIGLNDLFVVQLVVNNLAPNCSGNLLCLLRVL